jgi:hypothetical protein
MSVRENAEITTAKGREKKVNLVKDEKLKSFWDRLVDEWLDLRAKLPETKD